MPGAAIAGPSGRRPPTSLGDGTHRGSPRRPRRPGSRPRSRRRQAGPAVGRLWSVSSPVSEASGARSPSRRVVSKTLDPRHQEATPARGAASAAESWKRVDVGALAVAGRWMLRVDERFHVACSSSPTSSIGCLAGPRPALLDLGADVLALRDPMPGSGRPRLAEIASSRRATRSSMDARAGRHNRRLGGVADPVAHVDGARR